MATEQCWLVKTEATCYSIDDLKRDRRTGWSGVRNYQSRNFMRDGMNRGDLVLFYHSSGAKPEETGVAGIAKVAKEAHADPTALDRKDSHFDPKSTQENPIWVMVELEFVEKFPAVVSLKKLKAMKELAGLPLLQPGQRLSVQPVSPQHFRVIRKLGASS
jgi:predicted RNA-binding protein with PUA-like domain